MARASVATVTKVKPGAQEVRFHKPRSIAWVKTSRAAYGRSG
jgi:hypothetical protein